MKGLLAINCLHPLSFFDAKERTQLKPQAKGSFKVVGREEGSNEKIYINIFLLFSLHAPTPTRCTVALSSSPPISRDQRS